MEYRRLFIFRNTKNSSSADLAQKVVQCADSFWIQFVSEHVKTVITNAHEATDAVGQLVLYRNSDLYELSKESHEKGEKYFYAGFENPDDQNSRIVRQEPKTKYVIQAEFSEEEFMKIMKGSRTITMLECDSSEILQKAGEAASNCGLSEGKEYEYIRSDNSCAADDQSENEIIAFWTVPIPEETVQIIKDACRSLVKQKTTLQKTAEKKRKKNDQSLYR